MPLLFLYLSYSPCLFNFASILLFIIIFWGPVSLVIDFTREKLNKILVAKACIYCVCVCVCVCVWRPGPQHGNSCSEQCWPHTHGSD